MSDLIKMWSLARNLNFIHGLMTLLRRNPYYALTLLYINYTALRLKRLLKMHLEVRSLPDTIFDYLVDKYNDRTSYVDSYSYALGNPELVATSTISWFYICCTSSLKKYKILILPCEQAKTNELFVSETTRFNFENVFRLFRTDTPSYFILPLIDEDLEFAEKVTISLIANPYNCSNVRIDDALQNYFSIPRYLRLNDIFGIDIERYAPDYLYSPLIPSLDIIFFKVNSVKLIEFVGNESDGCYIVHGETTLVQEESIHSYLPCRYSCALPEKFAMPFNKEIERGLLSNCPPSLEEPLEQLETCILPFVRTDIKINIRPIFLVEGVLGSGKSKLIQIAAKRMGFHLMKVDFVEIQSLTAAQTETKLRAALNNAEGCMPCILEMNNIQIFGKDSEGQKDERTISAFSSELKKLFDKNLKYPIIVIATSDTTEIPIELRRMFIEVIYIERPNQKQRTDLLLWLLVKKGLQYEANLSQITGLCSDFVLADFEALISHTIKNKYKLMTHDESSSMTLMHDDFLKACEYMQSLFADRIGVPKVPKVRWEDIGGLADLKHEIIRRIELPLLTNVGLGRSGLLLYGPPGTGKTLLAKAVATECQLHFLSVKGPELLNMYVGQSEKNVRDVFERARAAAPCVIFFDELDSLAPNRGRSGDSGGVMDRVVSQLLTEMDGLESSGNIFIIGATNRPDLIDQALLRPGRFDKMFYVGIPSDRNSQLSILKAVTREFKMQEDGRELEQIVETLPYNLTGADLYALCADAWLAAVRRHITEYNGGASCYDLTDHAESSEFKGEITVELQDFIQVAQNLVPSVSKEEMQRYEELRLQLSSS